MDDVVLYTIVMQYVSFYIIVIPITTIIVIGIILCRNSIGIRVSVRISMSTVSLLVLVVVEVAVAVAAAAGEVEGGG